ncbi:MAG TPA: DMT family transporter [Acidimicrobiia bacterium]|nr:DMT family transporter [Acidimicrobiia bacterium]
MKKIGVGFLLVASGAALWGTDGLFRRTLAFEMPAPIVVFWEHLILVAVTLPLIIRFFRNRPRLDAKDLTALLFVGAGASAVATILFTQAFTYGDPTTPLLIQKTQPVIAILGAYLLLGERLLPRYGWYFIFAVGGAYLIAFPDPTLVTLSRLAPALLALGAAALWGMGTVLGRHLTTKMPTNELTALRFAIGLPTALIILLLRNEAAVALEVTPSKFGVLVLLALIPGLAALMVYYKGLSTTPASSATLAELAFPLTAILIGWAVFDTVPTTTQWAGILTLSATIVVMSKAANRGREALGVREIGPPIEAQTVQPR